MDSVGVDEPFGRSCESGIDAIGDASGGGVVPVEVRVVVDAVGKALRADFGVVSGQELADLVPVMNALSNQMAALDARFVEALDASCVWAGRGHRSVAAMLRAGSNAHDADAAGRARRAARLPKMRAVEEAFAVGSITADHVRVFGELTQRRWLPSFHDAEAYLVRSATELGWREFMHVIDVWKTVNDFTEPDTRAERDAAVREFHLSRSFKDRGIAKGTFTPEARVIVRGELDRITAKLLHHDREHAKTVLGVKNPTSADLGRTPQQRRHDAMVIMAQRSAAAEPGAEPTEPLIHVRVSQECLEAAALGAVGVKPVHKITADEYECELADGTPITYSQLMRHVIKAKIHTVVLSQEGAILHYGRGRRWFDRNQKQAISYRDRYCKCGCGMLARHCDIDHHIEWTDDGLSDIENGDPLCRRSHTIKTEHHKQKRKQQPQPDNNPDPP